MPGGGLVQVVARGNQDAYLTSKPGVTNWKAVYRRHTIFATESVEQVFNGTGDFGKKIVCTIQKTGDLVSKMYLRVRLPALGANQCWCPRVGFALLKYLELRVGGTPCEKQNGSWYNIRYELEKDLNKASAYDHMIGDTDALTIPGQGTPEHTLWIPLNFFCCRVDGLAIPLIATQYHDTQVEIEFNHLSQLICGSNTNTAGLSMLNCSLFVDFVYLGNVERKKFAESTHEYLIEQVQSNNGESVTSQSQKFRIDFNHPSKAFHVTVQQDKYVNGSKFLAWNPKDWEKMRVDATKRAAMAWGTLSPSGLYVANPAILDSDLKAAINGARVAGIDISNNNGTVDANGPDMDAVMILGYPLDDRYVSWTMEEWRVALGTAAVAARASTGDGAATKDCVVYDWTNYGVFLNRTVSPIDQVLISMNNTERLSKRESDYFNYVQAVQCFKSSSPDGLLSYSFALHPLEHQPSGTCNMSRIDNAAIALDFIRQTYVQTGGKWTLINIQPYTSAKCDIECPNYNVFRIMGGMAGMGFHN